MNQSGKVAISACGQLNRKMYFSLLPFALKNLVSRDGFGRPVPRQPLSCFALELNLLLT